MNCRDVQKFVYVYLDEEFDKRDSLEFEAHVGQCAACRQLVAEEEKFRLRLRNQLRARCAPTDLRSRIVLALDSSEASAAPTPAPFDRSPQRHRVWMAGTLAAGLAAVAMLNATSQVPGAFVPGTGALAAAVPSLQALGSKGTSVPSEDKWLAEAMDQTATEAVRLHQSDLPLDVQGDRLAVERFIGERFNTAFVAPIPESYATRLIGARLIHVEDRPAILFLYDHRGRRVSALQVMLPQSEPLMPEMRRERRRAGYNTIVFGQSECTVTTLVTDLPSMEAESLVVASTVSR